MPIRSLKPLILAVMVGTLTAARAGAEAGAPGPAPTASAPAPTTLAARLELGRESTSLPYVHPFISGLAVTDSALLARHVGGAGFYLVHAGAGGRWRVDEVPGHGDITSFPGGFLASWSGTSHAINADLSRTHHTTSELSVLDAATGATRWTAQWDGSFAVRPVALGDRIYVYFRAPATGNALIALDAAGKEVQRIPLPDAWRDGRSLLATGGEVVVHGVSTASTTVTAFDPATGRQTWEEDLGFGGNLAMVSGSLAVFHYPFDDGKFALVDLDAHRVLERSSTGPWVWDTRGMGVAGGLACFWGGDKASGQGQLRCLDLQTRQMRWQRVFEAGVRVSAGIVQQQGRLWIMVQGPEGPSRLLALDSATGATVRDLALGERLALLPRNPALLFQGLFVVGTHGGRVLGYELPKD